MSVLNVVKPSHGSGGAAIPIDSYDRTLQVRYGGLGLGDPWSDSPREVLGPGEILGRSPALKRALRQVEMVAGLDVSVLILGESGTGKELVARAIHRESTRALMPFVKVNCGSVPRDLFESEFFGHVRGAYTGAIRDRVGRFQLADRGTLFLDEVGEIPVELQSKLLRVLQEGEFERVGDDASRHVNVRVVAATNRDLRRDVVEGRFRGDLYYRLCVFPIEIPPLRQRREDIPDLVRHFVRQACLRFELPEPRILPSDLERTQSYAWPGNVRELQNMIERAVILARGGPMSLELPDSVPTAAPLACICGASAEVIPEKQWRNLERANILRALHRAGFRVAGPGGAAELLGVNPGTLASRLKAVGIDRRDYQG